MHEEDREELVPGKVAAEDYRRQRQTAEHAFEITGAGGVLMPGSLDLIRRTIHVLTTGNADFPPRDIHPPLAERSQTIGSFDDYVPDGLRGQCAAMRADLLGVIEDTWLAVEPILLGMFKKGLRLPEQHLERTGWTGLI